MITFSDANPIQIWKTGQATHNEKIEDGVDHVCFFQPWNCDDIIPFQFTDDDPIMKDYRLVFYNEDDEEVAELFFQRELVSDLWVYSLSFVPEDLGICNVRVYVKVVEYLNTISGGVTDNLELVDGELETMPAPSSREVVWLVDPEVCSGPTELVYYIGVFGPGTTLYLDPALTNSVSGHDYVSDAFDTTTVYEIDDSTGEIGIDTGFTCAG